MSKKRCYFWKYYRYHVSADQLTLKGYVEWCNDLYFIRYGKPRKANDKIFVNPDMTEITVKTRFWGREKIEKWLNDHGYSWTMTEEIKYQYDFEDPSGIELVDADAEIMIDKEAI